MSHLVAGRAQMGTSLAFHLSFAVFGVGLPVLTLIAEGIYLRTGDRLWLALARRWSKAFAILFAVGAVSGTIISFELGLLWPGLTRIAGGIIGLPFSLEGLAFFLEAIFLGIYLYGWDRLAPRVHWLAGVPIALSGIASAFFIVTANAWMNVPRGFRLEHGRRHVAAPRALAALRRVPPSLHRGHPMIARPPRARRSDLVPALAATVITAITAAPWALGFSASHAAVAGHIAFAMAFAPIALLISALPAAAVTTAAAGAWLAASPWALVYASLGATAWSADLLAGVTLIALGVCARHVGHHHTRPSPRPGPRA